MNNLRKMADELKQKLESVIIVLGAVKVIRSIDCCCHKRLIDQGYHAGKLLKEVATFAAVAAAVVLIWHKLEEKIQQN